MKTFLSKPMPAPNSFLPQDYINDRTDARANILTLTLFAITMAGVVGAFFVTNRHWQKLRQQQTDVNAEYALEGKKISQLKALDAQRSAIMEKAEITAALVEKLPRWAVLGEVSLRMPNSMRLDQLVVKSQRVVPVAVSPAPGPGGKTPPPQSLTKGAAKGAPAKDTKGETQRPKVEAPKFDYAVTIEGTADENNLVADFLTSLKRSPIFDKVELPYIRVAKEGERELRKFQITASLRANVGTGELAASLQDLVTTRTADLAQTRAQEQEKLAEQNAVKEDARKSASEIENREGALDKTLEGGKR